MKYRHNKLFNLLNMYMQSALTFNSRLYRHCSPSLYIFIFVMNLDGCKKYPDLNGNKSILVEKMLGQYVKIIRQQCVGVSPVLTNQ